MKIILLGVVIFLSLMSFSNAQTWNLPMSRANSGDLFLNQRPGMSLNGFDNTDGGSSLSQKTLGAKQVLERAYGIGQTQDATVEDVFNLINDRANQSLKSFTHSNAEVNSSILESMGFITLMTYIIEENDGGSGEPNIFTPLVKIKIDSLQSHQDALNDFINALEGKGDYFRADGPDDTFKQATALMKVVRAWDFYLALENAYEDLGGTISDLLSQSDKQWWNDAIHAEIKEIWQDANGNVLGGWSAGYQRHEVQPGNWPLIAFMGTGYATLGFNGAFQTFSDDNSSGNHSADYILKRGLKSVAMHYTDSDNKRYNYWWYQTDGGKPFFAEGANYLELALSEVIQFQHVLRTNDMLSYSSEGLGIDPFYDTEFLTPINWLAEISTPDGLTPPFDDGNKRKIASSTLLSWSGSYGKVRTGERFAYIRDLENIGIGSEERHRLVEIAIPRMAEGTGRLGTLTVNNDLYKQQVVAKYKSPSNEEHYLFLNGESDKAISRGEGHEQPDQLQLLYYIDGTSFLMDRGYDSAYGTSNSSWNFYGAHNVMNYSGDSGSIYPNNNEIPRNSHGLPSPGTSLLKGRKVSGHNWVDEIEISTPASKVIELKASVNLTPQGEDDAEINEYEYGRKVLLIKSEKTYVIDFNELKTSLNNFDEYSEPEFVHEQMYYTGFSDQFSNSPDWMSWDIHNSDKNLYMYLRSIEINNNTLEKSTYTYGSKETFNIKNATTLIARNPFGFPATITGGNIIERYYTTSALIVADNNIQPDVTQLFSHQFFNNPHKGWFWSPENDVIDVIVKRSKANSYEYGKKLSFLITDVEGAVIDLALPASKDYGFARLRYSNGEWNIDNDYLVNIIEDITQLTSTSNATLKGRYFVSNNTNITLSGSTTIEPGTKITLGIDSKITFTGNVIANGTFTNPIRFTSTDPNDSSVEYDRVYFNTMNLVALNWCVFEGGFYNADFRNINNVGIANSTFKNGTTGLYSYNTDLGLQDVTIKNNSSRGLVVSNVSAGIYDSRFENNGGIGIDIYAASAVTIRESIIEGNGSYGISSLSYLDINDSRIKNNNGHEIYVSADVNLVLNWDYNSIFDTNQSYGSGKRYIYKSNLTSTGENQTSIATYAHGNYWGQSQEHYNMFYGTVHASNNLTSDYTTGLNPGNSPQKINPNSNQYQILAQVNSSKILNNQMSSDNENSEYMTDLKLRFNTLQNRLAIEQNPLTKISILRSMRSFLKVGKQDLKIQKEEYKRILSLIKEEIKEIKEPDFFGLSRIDSEGKARPLEQHPDAKSLAEGYFILFEIEDEFEEEKYDLALEKIDGQIATTTNQDLIRSLLLIKLSTYERLEMYEEALVSLNEIENLKPDSEIAKGTYDAMDFSFLRFDLEEKAGLNPDRSLFKKKTAQTKGTQANDVDSDKKDETPNSFALHNSYPNPFNPSTNISFDLPENSFVEVEVFDINGRLVSVLANKEMNAGTHSLRFDASGLASGLYIVRARLGNTQFFDKITLIK